MALDAEKVVSAIVRSRLYETAIRCRKRRLHLTVLACEKEGVMFRAELQTLRANRTPGLRRRKWDARQERRRIGTEKIPPEIFQFKRNLPATIVLIESIILRSKATANNRLMPNATNTFRRAKWNKLIIFASPIKKRNDVYSAKNATKSTTLLALQEAFNSKPLDENLMKLTALENPSKIIIHYKTEDCREFLTKRKNIVINAGKVIAIRQSHLLRRGFGGKCFRAAFGMNTIFLYARAVAWRVNYWLARSVSGHALAGTTDAAAFVIWSERQNTPDFQPPPSKTLGNFARNEPNLTVRRRFKLAEYERRFIDAERQFMDGRLEFARKSVPSRRHLAWKADFSA